MRVVTWNVNSLRARLDRVTEWFAEVQPDVVCLQETKLADDAFPALVFQEMGYESVHFGQGQWNGVAILSRVGLVDPLANFAVGVEPDHEARIVSATCGGVRIASVYVPNGREVGHEHYEYKLGWLDRLVQHLELDTSPEAEVIIGGDYNIAPADRDVFDSAALVGSTHVTEPERQRLEALETWGLTDLFRHHHPEVDGVYSWWDYRNGDFHKGRGMRIDLQLASASVVARSRWTGIDRNARKGKQPSDHAPVVVDLES
jgi:exodeoxyribonuclease-3